MLPLSLHFLMQQRTILPKLLRKEPPLSLSKSRNTNVSFRHHIILKSIITSPIIKMMWLIREVLYVTSMLYAFPYPTQYNSKEVSCSRCHTALYTNPLAVNFCCQFCGHLSEIFRGEEGRCRKLRVI